MQTTEILQKKVGDPTRLQHMKDRHCLLIIKGEISKLPGILCMPSIAIRNLHHSFGTLTIINYIRSATPS